MSTAIAFVLWTVGIALGLYVLFGPAVVIGGVVFALKQK